MADEPFKPSGAFTVRAISPEPNVLSAAQKAEMLRRELAIAEEEELAQRAEAEKREKMRIESLSSTPTLEAHHERLGYLDAHKNDEREVLARHQRWLEVISEKLFGAGHGLSETFGEHHTSRTWDAENIEEANKRDVRASAERRRW